MIHLAANFFFQPFDMQVLTTTILTNIVHMPHNIRPKMCFFLLVTFETCMVLRDAKLHFQNFQLFYTVFLCVDVTHVEVCVLIKCKQSMVIG